MTTIIGQTEAGRKTTQGTLKVLPETVIYDVNHTLSLPLQMTVTSSMNAIAHAVETLYAQEANPVLSLMAEEGVAKMTTALDRVIATPDDIEARSDALYGAWLCAVCLGSGDVALHHKLCHVLGGSFNLPVPKRTLSCCLMRCSTMRPPCPRPWSRCAARQDLTRPLGGSTTLPRTLVSQWR